MGSLRRRSWNEYTRAEIGTIAGSVSLMVLGVSTFWFHIVSDQLRSLAGLPSSLFGLLMIVWITSDLPPIRPVLRWITSIGLLCALLSAAAITNCLADGSEGRWVPCVVTGRHTGSRTDYFTVKPINSDPAIGTMNDPVDSDDSPFLRPGAIVLLHLKPGAFGYSWISELKWPESPNPPRRP